MAKLSKFKPLFIEKALDTKPLTASLERTAASVAPEMWVKNINLSSFPGSIIGYQLIVIVITYKNVYGSDFS